MSILYVLGDSFTTPHFFVRPQDSYWGLLAKDLGVDSIINYSQSGFSLDQIVHILCNENLELDNNFLFLGIPPIERLILESEGAQWQMSQYDANFNRIKNTIESLNDTAHYDFEEAFIDAKFFLANYSFKWQQQVVCNEIFLIYQWLKNLKIKFLIVNLTAPFCFHGTKIEEKLIKLPECILFKDTCHSVNQTDGIKPADWNKGTGWYGHHGAEGNLNWYTKVLRPKAVELGWIAN